jgi:arylsulfatase A-like enzyme
VILILVDGLRADMMNEADTPRMHALAKQGVRFARHHAVFPCTTMTNAGAIATGSYPQKSSWWGEKVYAPTAAGTDSRGELIDFSQLVDVRDRGTITAINDAFNGQFATARTLFKTAKAAGLRTAILGKPGATFVQDMDFPTYFIDTDIAAPDAFARELLNRGFALPPSTVKLYPHIKLPDGYLNPYAQVPPRFLEDGVTSDVAHADSRPSQLEAYAYFVKQFVEFILPEKRPDLSFLWLNEPDASMHTYGPGSSQYRAALRAVDGWVAQIAAAVERLGLSATTDIIVTSDHGATTISGPTDLFPLRAIESVREPGGTVVRRPGKPDEKGWSVSGQALLVEVLRRGGFNAYNGRECVYDPVMTGLRSDGSPVFPTLVDDTGVVCKGRKHTSKGFRVPHPLGRDEVLIMETAGGDFVYVPSHDKQIVVDLVRFLQERMEIGPIFVHSAYGDLPGTLPMREIMLENEVRSRTPDLAISYWTDGKAMVGSVPGIGFHNKPSPTGMRGDHGALAAQDVAIPGFALGPDFRNGFIDAIPTSNVDLAPTIAHLLGLDEAFIAEADGRVMFEALRPGGQAKGRPETAYEVRTDRVRRPEAPAVGLRFRRPTDPDGRDVDPAKSSYSMELRFAEVVVDGKRYRYVGDAFAVRE